MPRCGILQNFHSKIAWREWWILSAAWGEFFKMRCALRVGITAAVGAVFALSFMLPAEAASIGEKTAQKQAEIPTCTHKLGTLAVREPQNRWWEGLGLE